MSMRYIHIPGNSDTNLAKHYEIYLKKQNEYKTTVPEDAALQA